MKRQLRHIPDGNAILIIERTKYEGESRYHEDRVLLTREELAILAKKYPVLEASK